MKKFLLTICLVFGLLTFFTKDLLAVSYSCSNRFAVLVNPVRGRNLWSDKSLKPIVDQAQDANRYNLPVTWLIQYDALTDKELVKTIDNFSNNEKGLFLEISKSLAEKSDVIYPSDLKWSNPGAVFLSAYSRSERKLLIDILYSEFKKDFGYYPKSIGAWWIDSYSLNYIKTKYGLSTALIVADQKTTDSYGVWGQWWGYPYFASKYNILIPSKPASSNPVIIQWAQRDPSKANGIGASFSNYSLQANDYIRSGENTEYFKKLVSTYLNCQNKLAQITMGMETGMEASDFRSEYQNQLKYLLTIENLKFVTMSDFATNFVSVYNKNIPEIKIGNWNLTLESRGDVKYSPKVVFADYFIADRLPFLNRDLSSQQIKVSKNTSIWIFSTILLLGTISIFKKRKLTFCLSILFCITSFGLLYKSGSYFGWQVFYGPILSNLVVIQTFLLIVVFIFFSLVPKKYNLFLLLSILSFGIDRIVSFLRFSVINQKYFIGILISRTHLIGLNFNLRLPVETISSFTKFPFDKIWQSSILYLIIYPIAHLLIGLILYFLIRKVNVKFKTAILILLMTLCISYIFWIFGFDPRWIS